MKYNVAVNQTAKSNENTKNSAANTGRIARVTEEHKGIYTLSLEGQRSLGRISGKMQFSATGRLDFPAVGDYVRVRIGEYSGSDLVIEGLEARRSCFVRKVAGNTSEEQVVAANVDVVFICMALNGDFNLKRLDRYLTLAWDSGAIPEVVLTKADLCDDVETRISDVMERAPGVAVHAVSITSPETVDLIFSRILPGKTAAFLGSSGVGKSTLINALTGKADMAIGGIREDDSKGRHTTTHRQLLELPEGRAVIDTPGMREIQLMDNVEGVERSFSDIMELAASCRFSDCRHGDEPGCAIQRALLEGTLDRVYYESYLKLSREAAFMQRKVDKSAASDYRKMLAKRYQSAQHNVKKKSGGGMR